MRGGLPSARACEILTINAKNRPVPRAVFSFGGEVRGKKEQKTRGPDPHRRAGAALRRPGRLATADPGRATASYPLNKDAVVRLDNPNGSYNVLVIENGQADVTEAGCPDKICVMMHPIRYDGESIICLPNRTEIRIEGGEASGADAVVP